MRRALPLLVLALLAAPLRASEPAGAHRLAASSSPYLLSHAGDPVGWYPWGEEAFAKARAEGRPVFLSIGYSSCHWCHVMAREVFSDPEIAALLDRWFVPVLIDREERPDVDEVYVTAVQLLTGDAGWPASVFLTPEGEPFFGGGYFPPAARGGRPGFGELLRRLHEGWTSAAGPEDDRRARMESVAERLTADVRDVLAAHPEATQGGAAGEVPTLADAEAEAERWKRSFDPEHGGFGRPPAFRPKFPSPGALRLLIERWDRGDEEAGRMVTATLRAMGRGAIHDRLGGGFHRYTVDREWNVPHFEKMLYDNALLAELCAEVSARTGDGADETIARLGRETLDFLLAAMALAPGAGKAGFASSIDADEEYYRSAARERLPAPRVDGRVLTDWNGLAVAALARGASAFGEPRYLDAARETAAFLLREMRPEGGPLLHARGTPAQLDDYAFLIDGLLALAAAEVPGPEGDRDGTRWLTPARELADEMEARLAAPAGGWYASASDPLLPVRARTVAEGALPAGGAVAILDLLALAARLEAGDVAAAAALRRRAAAALAGYGPELGRSPGALPTLALAALRFHGEGPDQPHGPHGPDGVPKR